MANTYFNFKQFSILQEKCAMKVGTDSVLLGAWANAGNANAILDIGTGTGLLALMLAQESSAIKIDAIDCEEGAFLQATENVKLSQWGNRISVYHASLQLFQDWGKKYDLIISNPPFFVNSLKSPENERTLARHNDSLSSAELLAGIGRLLEKQGRFVVILPYLEAQLFIVDATLSGFYCIRKTEVSPSPGKKVHRVMMEFSAKRKNPLVGFLAIRNADGEYSKEYKELTNKYYLNF